MKKLMIASVFVSLLSSTSMVAQGSEDQREKLSFGVRAGLNYSNVWDEQGQDFTADGKTGFAAGAFLAMPLGKLFGIQPEILLSQKGFQGSGMFLGTSYSFSRTTTFLDIPIQFQVKPSEYFTLVAGPQYSFLLNRKDVFNFGGNSLIDEEDFENNNIRKNILGATVGFDINFSRIVISARASWDLQNNNGDGTSTDPRYKNRVLQVTAGYRF